MTHDHNSGRRKSDSETERARKAVRRLIGAIDCMIAAAHDAEQAREVLVSKEGLRDD